VGALRTRVQYSLWIPVTEGYQGAKILLFLLFSSLCLRLEPWKKNPFILKKCQSKNSGTMGFVQHICFSYTVLPFPSSLSLLLLGTSGAHFSVRLINPFLVFHILFQSFLYIIVCCLYLLVLHSMHSITQFVFLLFQAMWFPWIPFWIGCFVVSQHFYMSHFVLTFDSVVQVWYTF